MVLLYGRAGRLTAKNAGFRPGQWAMAHGGWPTVWKGLTAVFGVGGVFAVLLQVLNASNKTSASLLVGYKPPAVADKKD
jgi:hypothetical protein